MQARLLNLQRPARAKRDTTSHYDVGNDFFGYVLGEVPVYTCGYWDREEMSLEDANRALLDLMCRKLRLQHGQRLLDVGCGWGALLEHAARHYGVEGVGVNISEVQLEACRERCAGLPVTFEHVDCRLLDTDKYAEGFDAVSAVALVNHIGPKNYDRFFSVLRAVLKDSGLLLLQGIANQRDMHANDPFMNKYVFRNAVCPSLSQILGPVEALFTLEDFHNFTSYYPRTLKAWHANLVRHWDARIRDIGFTDRFRRVWDLYLLGGAGTCRARGVIIFQSVFSKGAPQEVYAAVR